MTVFPDSKRWLLDDGAWHVLKLGVPFSFADTMCAQYLFCAVEPVDVTDDRCPICETCARQLSREVLK